MKKGMGHLFLFTILLLFIGSPLGMLGELPVTDCVPESCRLNDINISVSESPGNDIYYPDKDILHLKNFFIDNNISHLNPYTPRYSPGMIITKDDGDLLLVTRYIPDYNRYCTRVILVGNGEYLYLMKDTSFMQMGSSCDRVDSVEFVYPYLYDDLNENSNENSDDYRNMTRDDLRIYIKYEDCGEIEVEGYLTPGDSESMRHVTT
ncbi:MAG: hypothetical protein JW931_04395 [Methanomicrobiaceae archaeon]|nr:hypothetical protein [Methanomicrobiaceae archaeon]